MTTSNILYLFITSSFTFFATIIFIPLIIIRIPKNYFKREKAPKSEKWDIPKSIKIIFLIFKNLLGIILIIGGIIMLFTPGQGLITILIGITITNFPKKRQLERRIISNKYIFTACNKIRSISGVKPLARPKFKKSFFSKKI